MKKTSNNVDESQVPYTFLEEYIGKKVDIRMISGRTMQCVVRKISAYELFVEEGMRAGIPVPKLVFKHAIESVSLRPEQS